MRQAKMHTAELSAPELSAEIVTTKFTSPVTDSSLAEEKHHILRFRNLHMLVSIENCHSSGKNILFIIRVEGYTPNWSCGC
jgi:hypothetical protein